MMASAFVEALPSPPGSTISLGPLRLNAYGMMIALGILAAVMLASRRLEAAKGGTRDDMVSIAVWGVVAGVVGARFYHVVTDVELFRGRWERVPMVWKGGLGIPGGLLGGVFGGLIAARRRGVAVASVLTASAPAIPLAQSIGRWGNWWNQELFGGPTSLPWALRVSADKVPAVFAPGTTFHPTFLYESLWTLMLCLVLLCVDKIMTLRPGRLFALYVVGYFSGRFWIEGLRIDRAHEFAGLRLNQWVSIGLVSASSAYLIADASLHRRERRLVQAVGPEARSGGVVHPGHAEREVERGDHSDERDGSGNDLAGH